MKAEQGEGEARGHGSDGLLALGQDEAQRNPQFKAAQRASERSLSRP